jgi:hypothetical protein
MARYRTKDEVDLRWNAIRRAATARIDLETKAWRERRLNEVLSELWEKFAAGINQGEVLELEPEYEQWIADSLDFKTKGIRGEVAASN